MSGRIDLWIANEAREIINEVLSRYDVSPEVTDRDVCIDASCVILADKIIAKMTSASGNLQGEWACPIGEPDCRKNCGSYGCGN